jgi:hypothetical protein
MPFTFQMLGSRFVLRFVLTSDYCTAATELTDTRKYPDRPYVGALAPSSSRMARS